jgi:hypothetical protein
MRTLVISDLHLGSGKHADLLRRPELRDGLLEAVAGVDRLVILGDGLELRDAAHRDALAAAGDLYRDVGRALGPDGELAMTAGNHDHGLVAGWIDGRLQGEPPGFLGLAEPIAVREAGPLAARLAALAAPARVTLTYPGVWIRDDVYALHGHYLDLHATTPTFEVLAAGAMARWVTAIPDAARPDDYEAALAPLYAFLHVVTQRAAHGAIRRSAGASVRGWDLMAGAGRRERPLRAGALLAGYGATVAALERLGLGPFEKRLSGATLRRGGLHGIGEVVRRLGVRAGHVLFGHTHRSGPWPHDDLAEWTAPTGARLHNTGSWVYQPHFLGAEPNTSPYWPGTAILVEDAGPPRLIRLLGERGHADLRPPG